MSDIQPSQTPTSRRGWFYWFLAVIALYSFIWDCLLEFDFITHLFAPDVSGGISLPLRITTGLVLVPLILIIAWLVLRRAPDNVVGLFLVIWSATVVSGSMRADSPYRAWGANFIWPTVILLPFYFPDGKPSPRRLGWLVNILAALCFSSLFLTILTTPPGQNVNGSVVPSSGPNAFYVPVLLPLAPIVFRVLGVSLTGIIILILPSLIIRYRRGDHRERLQMKWLAAFSILFLVMGNFLALSGLFDNPNRYGPVGEIIVGAFYLYLGLFIPLGVANAIFRHRLYDIDIIIRRTLIYTTLTVILAIVYFAAIIVTQGLLRTLTGQTSDLAIVVSTLIIAALFTPLRQRIQNGIDRRFYRRRYDAERTLTAFSATVRNEVNLDKLNATLVDVVEETMRPSHVILWLREPVQKPPENSPANQP